MNKTEVLDNADYIYICGGRLGDLIHTLVVIHDRWLLTGKKGKLYITDNRSFGGDEFAHGATCTHQDLHYVISAQPYISEFGVVDATDQEYTNLNIWRYQTKGRDWIDILQSAYGIPFLNQSGPWLSYPPFANVEAPTKGKIAIHRSTKRHNDDFPWDYITKNNDCIFVYNDPVEYEQFPFRDRVPGLHAPNFETLTRYIDAANGFVGNQSAPAALAWALGKPVFVELFVVDKLPYMSKHIGWFFSNTEYSDAAWLNWRATTSIVVPVSVGEAMDKLSILQIKRAAIGDLQKQLQVQREIEALDPLLAPLLSNPQVRKEFDNLVAVNKRIWDLVDVARDKGTTDPIVMRENDARFRVKSRLNHLTNSYLHEQKNFDNVTLTVNGDDQNACIETIDKNHVYYDRIFISCNTTTSCRTYKDMFANDPVVVPMMMQN